MSQFEDVVHLARLVRLSADTIRLVCSTKVGNAQECPFRDKVVQLKALADEIEAIARTLPADWREVNAFHAPAQPKKAPLS